MSHLAQLHQSLRSGGTLIVETFITEESKDLPIEGRYARMRNVFLIPTISTVIDWLKVSQFTAIELVDVNRTTVEEQRTTPWMHFQSLKEALDPTDATRTIEGHPSPLRATFIARKSP